MEQYDRDYELSSPREAGFWRSWGTMLLIAAVIVGWGVFIWAMVKEGPRNWDFGGLPDAPGESAMSTSQVQQGKVPRQIPQLPEIQQRKNESERGSGALGR